MKNRATNSHARIIAGESSSVPIKSFRTEKLNGSGVRSIIGDLRQSGFVMLPGWAAWLERLSPLKRTEAWPMLFDPHTISIISDHPLQQDHFGPNDDGGIDEPGQPSVGVEVKRGKRHLTLVEGGDWMMNHNLLPLIVQNYLGEAFAFLRAMRCLFDDVLPPTELPTHIQCRIFDYAPYDLWDEPRPAMRSHVDGTVLTVVIAETADHALQCRVRNRWQTVGRSDGRPFAVAFSGSAAMHDFGLPPIEHKVQWSAERRVSIATRLAPDLGTGTREQAERRLARWRLASGKQFPDARERFCLHS